MSKRFLTIGLVVVIMLLATVSGVLAAGEPLTIDADHMVIEPGQSGFQVQEMFTMINSGSTPYKGTALTDPSGKKKIGWLFLLPTGFQNLQVQGYETADYAAISDGVQIYKALPTGQTQMSITYDLPESSLPATVVKKFSFATGGFYVYTPKDYLTVTSEALQQGDTFQISGQDFLQYNSTGSFKPDQVVNLSVEQAPAPQTTATDKVASGFSVKFHPDAHVALFMSEPLSNTNPHIWATYMFIMIGLGIAAAILYVRLRIREADEKNNDPELNEYFDSEADADAADPDEIAFDEAEGDSDDANFLRLKAKQDVLLQRIKSLDEQFESGSIEEQQYRATRDKLKQLLVQVKLQLKELT